VKDSKKPTNLYLVDYEFRREPELNGLEALIQLGVSQQFILVSTIYEVDFGLVIGGPS
jgi:hypothetical protein